MHIFFKNPGVKIKRISLIPFVFCCIVSLVCGIVCMAQGGWFVALGFVIMPPIAFSLYVPVLFLYAVGEFVDKTTKIEENTREIRNFLSSKKGYYEEKPTTREGQPTAVFKSNLDENLIDYVLAQEEDRVETLAKDDPSLAVRLEVIQEMCKNGFLNKQQYFEELRKI